MKRKLLVLFVTMLAVLLCFTSCNDIIGEYDFDYTATMAKLYPILPTPIYNQVANVLALFSHVEEFEEYIPVERVEIINEGMKYSETMGNYIVIFPDENGERSIKIDYEVYPDNAKNTTVDFVYEEVDYATVDENSIVTFTEPGVVRLTVIATDGSNAEDTILIIAK